MFKQALNTPLKLVECNLNIYLMLFEFKKLFFTLPSLATHGIFLSAIYFLCVLQRLVRNINPIRNGGEEEAKSPPSTSFSPVTSTNVGFGPQTFLTFSFNPFARLGQNFKFVPSASHPSKPRPPLKKSDFFDQILVKLRL